jgi:hypothetical protein
MPKSQDQDTSMSKHVHHWKIEPAAGPISRGKCAGCKEERDFENSIFAESQHISLAKERWNDRPMD